MKLHRVRVRNVKSIADSGDLEFGPITLIVGKNNSGKSTLLRSIHHMQGGGQLAPKDVRYGNDVGSVKFSFEAVDTRRHWGSTIEMMDATLELEVFRTGQQLNRVLVGRDGTHLGIPELPARAPQNFIFPFLSGRKVAGFEEVINRGQALAVTSNLSNLVARVDLLMDRQHPQHETFMELVDEVIGLKLSAIASDNGKRVGIWVNNNEAIYLDEMGDGISQLLGFIVNLCLAENQLFLIEELENDVHPEALRLLLAVISRRRTENQFIISTHNNIILRILGSLPETKIYQVTSTTSKDGAYTLPTTQFEEVGNTPADRTAILRNLGYELSDMDLWDGWLILEESSAERIIRDHLVRWFAPGLSRVRPVAANGTSDVERTFESLYKLSLFTHLEHRYRGRVRVIVDGDPSGLEVVEKLRSRFKNWPRESFESFSERDFERYFPDRFQGNADEALALSGARKRAAKKELLTAVLTWIDENEAEACSQFEVSAAEVIEKLRSLESALGPAAEQD